MKKIINVLSVASAAITSVLIICTFLTSYHFYYVGLIFNSYRPIQIGVAVTMCILGIRLLINEEGIKKFVYFLLCLLISASLLFSMTLVK
ncbi:MAG: hypothetical protein GX275_12375 [Clostridiales bacterium]|nr:hypothetical protein [Clostridiales bacterium]